MLRAVVVAELEGRQLGKKENRNSSSPAKVQFPYTFSQACVTYAKQAGTGPENRGAQR